MVWWEVNKMKIDKTKMLKLFIDDGVKLVIPSRADALRMYNFFKNIHERKVSCIGGIIVQVINIGDDCYLINKLFADEHNYSCLAINKYGTLKLFLKNDKKVIANTKSL